MVIYDTRLQDYGEMLRKTFPTMNFKITDKVDIGIVDEGWAFGIKGDTIECDFVLKDGWLSPEELKRWYEAACDFARSTINNSLYEKYDKSEFPF